jgi:methylated-DNA-protein-cysteine methyltransferase related protein
VRIAGSRCAGSVRSAKGSLTGGAPYRPRYRPAGACASPPPNATPWPNEHQPTPFQQAVLEAVAGLAPGDLVGYGELAEELGRPGGAQAVANVLRSAPGLPWWRVVPADGRLYRSHAPVQAPLLEAEGHTLDGNRRLRSR